MVYSGRRMYGRSRLYMSMRLKLEVLSRSVEVCLMSVSKCHGLDVLVWTIARTGNTLLNVPKHVYYECC